MTILLLCILLVLTYAGAALTVAIVIIGADNTETREYPDFYMTEMKWPTDSDDRFMLYALSVFWPCTLAYGLYTIIKYRLHIRKVNKKSQQTSK